MDKRSSRAGVEDRWHRPARKGETVPFPADHPGAGCWCIDSRHGEVGKLVTTLRHGQGKRWMARWVDHDGQERTKSFTRQAEAQRHVTQVTADLTTGTYVDTRRSGVTFGVVAEEWFTAKSANRAPKTIAGYRSLLDIVVLPKWKNERLRDIDHGGLQAWVTFLSTDPAARQQAKRTDDGEVVQAGLSPARVIHAYQVVRQVLAYAVRTKHLSANPADSIELPRKPQGKDLALTHEQVRQLAEASADMRVMVLFLAYTGLRFGEAIALRVGDVDTEARKIMVSKSITHVQKVGHVEGDTKTHQRRVVPILTTALNDELKRLMVGRGADEYLFVGIDGGAMTLGRFRWRFDPAVAAMGLDGVTPHTLRHTAGSLAISETGSVVTASKLLGHRNISTTANVYTHLIEGDWEKLSAAMEKATTR